jgi:hypothetical protein
MVQEKTQKRPQAVVIAVSLFALSHAINDIIRIAEVGIPLRASYFIALTMVWGPVLLVSAATYRGKNWGRMLIAGFTIVGMSYLPWSLPPVVGTRMALVQLSQATLCVAATFLLFQPAARCWFRSPKKAPMTPAR